MKCIYSTILVVDDDENDRLFIQTAFVAIGVTSSVHVVEGGEEAIKYLAGQGRYSDRDVFAYPNFVITDLKMPGLDGFQLLQHIRHCPKSVSLPTVVLSGSEDNDDIQRAVLLGANSYHVKPGSPSDLRALLRALHDYWMTCEFPVRSVNPKPVTTEGRHKLGAQMLEGTAPWFPQSPSSSVTS